MTRSLKLSLVLSTLCFAACAAPGEPSLGVDADAGIEEDDKRPGSTLAGTRRTETLTSAIYVAMMLDNAPAFTTTRSSRRIKICRGASCKTFYGVHSGTFYVAAGRYTVFVSGSYPVVRNGREVLIDSQQRSRVVDAGPSGAVNATIAID